ncbi:HCP-like protein [Delitschia confertaspora ATCC 74209]|uniref:HCP-like protein n=1 Tax=Delitschia confertaspora ATCC 74209 TaxID=1513339 RepID=A0A9P4JHR7_9PLEO|nr:HCP-like protein [Delitschia confertaspora ATCC 74209]
MPLKDLLRKKDKIRDHGATPHSTSTGPTLSPDVPEFTFMRTTTTTQEVISPPSFPGDPQRQHLSPEPQKRVSRFRRQSNAPQPGAVAVEEPKAKGEHRLSERLHIGRTRSSSSVNVPENLPTIDVAVAKTDEDEARWEKRATLLAKGNSVRRAGNTTPNKEGSAASGTSSENRAKSSAVSNPGSDENIQEAIRLHESGQLEESTAMFGRLADPNGANNALSQVLYGLALRHGWGCDPNPEQAITYLSYAASNSAEVESLALSSGLKKGGAAKGELVLAIYELANCFRNGWGVKKDPVAAKQYYETAANLGDTDAMNEVAWCYLEGFGCKKDKFKAAQFLRLAEEKGSKTLGNTWIWKDKYNPK